MGERRGLFSPFSSSLVPAPRRRRRSASRVSTTKTRKKYPHRIHHTAPNNLPPRGRGKEKRLAISRACRETKRIGFLRQEEAAKRRRRSLLPGKFRNKSGRKGEKARGKKVHSVFFPPPPVLRKGLLTRPQSIFLFTCGDSRQVK